MPTYVYACRDCGAQFEQFQRFSDEPLTICPRCQGTIKRVFQPVGIVFKGSGWYINDSRNSSQTSSTPAAKSEKSDNGSEAKNETSEKKEAAPASDSTPAKTSETSTSKAVSD